MIKLTAKQELFAQELAKGKTQADAYRKAYPKSLDWQDNTVWNKSSLLSKKGYVMARVAEIQSPSLKKLQVTVDRVLEERAKMALYDTGDIADGRLTGPQDIAALPDDIRQAITGWKWDKQGNFIVTLADKNAHLTALEKHLGMYKDDTKDAAPLAIHIHIG